MEYSLSDIQLPDPPKEKSTASEKKSITSEKKSTSEKKGTASESSNKISQEMNSTSELEENHAFQNEGKIAVINDSMKGESNDISKEVCDPASPKDCVISKDSKDHLDPSQSGKQDVNEELKNSPKEGDNHKMVETPPVVEEYTDAKEVGGKHDVVRETICEENFDSANDVSTTKQTEAEVESEKNSSSSISNASSKTKEQQSKHKKCDAAISASKEKLSQDATSDEPAVDKESAKIVRKRKNRRTSRSSSQSSSSSSSSTNSSSPERGLSHSKKSRKSGSSSEGIASPSSSGSSSDGESEDDKKCLANKKPETGKASTVTKSEETVKRRRKINRDLPVKGFQENIGTKGAEAANMQEPSTASHKMKTDETNKNEDTKKTEVREIREIKFTPRKLSLTSLKSSEKSEAHDSEKSNSKLGGKKRKWGNCTSVLPRASVSISSDSLKTLIPDLKPFAIAPVLSDQDELSNPAGMESPPKKEQKIVNLPAPEEMVHEEISTYLQMDKASNAGDMKEMPNKSNYVSPPHNPTSNILFIKNLVRPFTLLQLKELLKQTGKLDEESFWIDKIKSKCIVVYETEEQAVATRSVLHGTRWPLSNPKILSVDFSTKEELDAHRNMTELPKPVKAAQHIPLEKQEIKETHAVDVPKRKNREDHKRDKERQKLPITHVREWDKDKLTQDSPDQASHRVEKDNEKSRSDKRKEKKDSKRRVDDDAPAKLLDDLFRKTRASPCIYWLPLTEEQAKQREDERQARRIEREKRWQQRKEQEENERRNRNKGHSGREKENRRSQSRSRSPQGRRR